jgi:hypothetical protein
MISKTMIESARVCSRIVASALMMGFLIASTVRAQDQPLSGRIEEFGLETMTVGRVTALYAPDDQARARQLAELAEAAATFFERELGVAFEFRLAVLGPKHWFSPHGAELPYGIPWCSVAERLMVVPASLQEGALISGPNEEADRRRVDFVTLHELGHLAAKQYFHPGSAHEEFPVLWFEELIATYFDYAYVASFDPGWAESARRDWAARVEGFTPRTLSLDWGFMRNLPADELGPTYGWYQNVLNLRVADLYEEHGLGFLPTLREKLPLDTLDDWTTESLLAHLEQIAPGFQRWADDLQRGGRVRAAQPSSVS